MDRQQHITDIDIEALLDNELNWEQEKRIRSHLDSDPRARARYEMLRAQKMLLQEWWKAKRSH